MRKKIIIAGAGGISQGVAVLLADYYKEDIEIHVGNRTLPKAEKLAHQIEKAFPGTLIHAHHLPLDGLTDQLEKALERSSILLDCLPGSEAPRMAKLALKYELHYANLTEYVAETNTIMALAENANTGFILQTGLAPGFINVLAHRLFAQFCERHQVNKVDSISMKVGALTRHAMPPHYYGFTWSPVGVATEYLMNAVCLREGEKVEIPALSETQSVIVDAVTYEEDLTSGGAADLPDFFKGKVRHLDYKTLRYPGHYAWVKEKLASISNKEDTIRKLQEEMELHIPHVEDDLVIIYCSVEGIDKEGNRQRIDKSFNIASKKVGDISLRAIQVTTAAPLAECARILLEGKSNGIILQSDLDPPAFLNGPFIKFAYGT